MFSSLWRHIRPSYRRSRRQSLKNRTASRGSRLGNFLEPLETRALMAGDLMGPLEAPREIFVAPSGDDWNNGAVGDPFLTLRRALDAARPGDTITLRNGVYEGGVNIEVDHLTIRSMPGEWAVIESPLTLQTDGRQNSVIRYNWDVQGGRLENLEIVGGYYYGVMFWDWWDYPSFTPGSTNAGPSGITLDHVKVHDTGVDAIKITPGADNITIVNSEVYNAGRRTTSSADGIDNNNGDNLVVRNTYVHDVPGIGIVTSGGAINALIEGNLVKDVGGAGIVAGFYSELEWLDPTQNPGHFAAIQPVVRNNIVVNAAMAGVGIYGADGAQIHHNTLVNAATDAQAPIQFGGYDMWIADTAPEYEHIASVDPSVLNSIIVTSPDNRTRMVDIREGSITGGLTLDYNLYYGTSTRGILFIDRNLSGEGTPEQTFAQWQANYGYDLHSLVADPQLAADWHLRATSPAIGRALGLVGVTTDFDGNSRAADPPGEANPPQPDLGADEFDAGPQRLTPPAPFGAPSIEIAERSYHDIESRTIQVKVLRRGAIDSTVTVQYATLDGTAAGRPLQADPPSESTADPPGEASFDFEHVAGTLTFAPGETEQVVAVRLLADGLAEGDEHFLFTLANAITDGTYPVRLGHQATASMTIDDADTPPITNYATKWVSPTGSDVTGDGSRANPWKSLQHAADHVVAGDYVLVLPGKYWGMNLTTDGKPDARITFHALPGVEIDEPLPGQQDGINLEGADFVTIEGFYVHDMPRAGLRSVNNDGVILRNNKADHNMMWGILTGWSENIVVESNETSRSQVEHGIYISNSADGAIVRNNVSWGNRSSGIQFNADRFLPGDGVHSNNLIEGNVIYDNGRGGGAALNFDGLQDSVIRNNLLYDNHAGGIVLYVGFAADGSKNNLVTNNTVLQAADGRWALLITDGSSGNVVTNNILLNLNPNRGSMTVEQDSLPALSNFNIVQDLFQLDGDNGSFAQWQAFAAGQDANSLVIPPADVQAALQTLFVNPAAGDFHLKDGSAAIDAGTSQNAPATDIYGHIRPTGAGVDIGAFEAGTFAPSIRFESANWMGYEFNGLAEITLVRTGDTEGVVAVDVASSLGTATPGSDYEPVATQVVFRPGEVRKTFQVFVHDDAQIEPLETVGLQLVAHDSAGSPLSTDDALLHLQSDDAWQPGTLEFDRSTVAVNEADGTATITVHRVGGSSGQVTVDFATELWVKPRQATWIKRHTELLYPTDNDTPATAGDDYVSQAGTLTFADGQTEQTITLQLVDDAWYEGGEAFVLRLSHATGGAKVGAKSNLKVHIDSDDAKQAGTFVWGGPTYSVVEGTPMANVTIHRLNGNNVEAAVHLYDTGAGNGTTTGSAWAPSDYGPLPWEVVFAVGESSKTISIPIVDDSSTEIDEVFSIRLHSPSNGAEVGALHTTFVTIQDNESTISFLYPNGQWNYSVLENAGSVPVTLVRQGSLATPASAHLRTTGSSAVANVDFTLVDVTVDFAPGESTKIVHVPIINDTMVEPTESFSVDMSNVVGATQGGWSAWVGILNDDVAASPGKLQLASATFSGKENGGSINVTVNRVDGSDGTVSVQYRTSDGAAGISYDRYAWAGAHYSGTYGTLTFGPGETAKTISIPVIDNSSASNANKQFTVALLNAAGGAQLGATAKAVVTILDDDSAIEFAQTSYSVNESAGVMQIRLRRIGSAEGSATVDLNISGGSAEAGKDFLLPGNKTVTFASGEYEKLVDIAIIDDLLTEGDENLYLSLSNATGAKLGTYLWGGGKILASD